MAMNNLPVPLTRFIGRDEEINEMLRLSVQTRLLTLTGSGGCGKTRLALEVATRLGDSFERNVAWVELAPLADGALGQMMEKVEMFPQQPRFTEFDQKWATTGKTTDRERNIITSLDLDPARHERHNLMLQAKYQKMRENEVRYEAIQCDDADYDKQLHQRKAATPSPSRCASRRRSSSWPSIRRTNCCGTPRCAPS